MKKEFHANVKPRFTLQLRKKPFFAAMLFFLMVFLVAAYIVMPPLGFRPAGMIFGGVILAGTSLLAAVFFTAREPAGDNAEAGLLIFLGLILLALGFVLPFLGHPLINAKRYASSVTVNQRTVEEAEEVLPSLDDVERISLMDTKSARKLGDRTLGTLAQYVSQYEVSDSYSTISYQGRVVKVAPLEYGSFWKAMKNRSIPGYVLVDVVSGEAKFVEVAGGLKYSMSAYFNKNAYRKVWLHNPSLLMDRSVDTGNATTGGYRAISFQLDEEGTPYFVFTTFGYRTILNCEVPKGVAVLNACTGEVTQYALEDIPEWIELTYSGDEAAELYNRYGRYLNGYFNFSKTGETKVTDDYGYLEKDGDIYIYTGVTSVGGDESNIGFLLVNSRTGTFDFYPITGAEEYSAMAAAEGLVQNYGYSAAFPSLVLVNGEPTYVMCLRDDNLLVKQYAMVNVSRYSIVAVADTLEETMSKYSRALATAGTGQSIQLNQEYKEISFEITEILYLPVDGETFVYWKDAENHVYRQNFRESLLLVNVGDKVTVEYAEIGEIRVIKP